MNRRFNWKLVVGTLILVAFLAVGLFPHAVTRYTPFATDVWHSWDLSIPPFPPSKLHWLGTDDFGRDTYTQLIYGIVPTLRDATLLVTATLVGSFLIASITTLYRPRFVGFLMDTMTQSMTLVPPVILAILVLETPPIYFSTHSAWWYYCVIGILEIVRFVPVIEGDMRLISDKPFIEGAITVGNSKLRVFRVHMLKWLWPYLFEYIPSQYARILTVIGELAYFGLFSNVKLVQGQASIHVMTTDLDWSAMIGIGGHNWFSVPGVVFFTTLAFCLLILAFRFVSSGMADLGQMERSYYWPETRYGKLPLPPLWRR